ncbi:universal stress protein [Pedobacter sp. SL55]|uniref:universal stress protein n=1 Tax=Pedobacter sp. SL55 TaxID=2995161 RepID=UPI00226D9B70|nr:universal stress protein [Pedobacter sp. SL55]WAC39397.1 universal stress protein [Pedobacter sp. SL55]
MNSLASHRSGATNQSGSLKDVAENVLFDQFMSLTVMGAHGAGGFSEFILGTQSRYMIDNFGAPLLLVPLAAKIKPIRKIAFATDFRFTQLNKEFVSLLVPLARSLGAEIFIIHVHSGKNQSEGFDEKVNAFMFHLSCEFKSPRISYRSVENFRTKDGLEKLVFEGQMDVLAMVHRKACLLSNLLLGSLTKRMASAIDFPLLVLKQLEKSPMEERFGEIGMERSFDLSNV